MTRPALVTLVTPSYNQARFLAEAIDTVLTQSYPRIEYWVIDGGSTDGSVELLHSYGDRLRWVSEPDRGQSHAINKGMRRARGDFVGWLNSDDRLLPGAIEKAVAILEANATTGLVYGQGEVIDEQGRRRGSYAGTEPFNLWRLLFNLDYVLQPATLFRRQVFEQVGGLREDLHWSMDWDLWLRMAAISRVEYLDEPLACTREYDSTKTATGGYRRIAELSRLAHCHTGRRATRGVLQYGLETLARDLERWPPFLGKLPLFLARRLWRRLAEAAPVYADGWLGPRSWLVVPSAWRRVVVELEILAVPDSRKVRVRLACDGRRLAELAFERPGIRAVELALTPPRGASQSGSFRQIEVHTSHVLPASSRSNGDRRRLAVLMRHLERLDGRLGSR